MQEVLPVAVQPISFSDIRKLGSALKKIFLLSWKAMCGLLGLILAAPPEQRYIEEQRLRAMRLTGHF